MAGLFNFDSELFDTIQVSDEKYCKNHVKDTSYIPKLCEDKWYLVDNVTEINANDKSLMEQLKSKGDYYYLRGNYEDSLLSYSGCLALVQHTNHVIKSDVLEGLARCNLHLGNTQTGLQFVEDLKNTSQTEKSNVVIDNLLVDIYTKAGLIENKIYHLHKLVEYLPNHVEMWTKLSNAYCELVKNQTDSSLNQNKTCKLCDGSNHAKENNVHRNCYRTLLVTKALMERRHDSTRQYQLTDLARKLADLENVTLICSKCRDNMIEKSNRLFFDKKDVLEGV